MKTKLINGIKVLFEDTIARIVIDGETVDEFTTKEGVRQGCRLSPTLFNIAMADLEEEMTKVQGSGGTIGKRRLRSIAYADNIVLIAEDEEIMEMLKRLRKWIEGKGLELNAAKTNVMIFRKAGGRRKRTELKWGKEELEIVKSFEYLGYIIIGNNKDGEHIKKLKGKANGTVGRL